jgi:hypothetical protein
VGHKAGFIDVFGKIVVKPQYYRAWPFVDGWAPLQLKEGKRGDEEDKVYVDVNGRFSRLYRGAGVFSEGLSVALERDGAVFIDRSLSPTTSPTKQFGFISFYGFSDGLLRVTLKDCVPRVDCGKSGYVDRTGKIRIPPRYSVANEFHDGIAAVAIDPPGAGLNDNEWLFIDENGKEITSRHFFGLYAVTDFSEGLAGVQIGEKWGFIDKTGKVVIEPTFEAVQKFSEGFAAVRLGCAWGFIDHVGVFAIKPQFRHATEFSDGLAAVDTAGPASGDCPHAGIHGQLGYIDRTGKTVISPQFILAEKFDRGVARVGVEMPNSPLETKIGYIDKTGRFIWKPTR